MDITSKIPPQSIDAEESLIAAILVEPATLDDIISIIKSEMFYKEAHQLIYRAILSIHGKGEYPDIISVTEKLRKDETLDKVGGQMFILNISDKVVSAKYAFQHARIIKDSYIRREYIRVGGELVNKGYDQSIESNELSNYAESSLYSLSEESVSVDPEWLSRIYATTLDHINKISTQETELSGIPSGLTELDRMTLGFQKSDLILLAARPSMGKTAFSLFISKNATSLGYKVLFFSLEMSKRQLSYRLLTDRHTDITDLQLGKNVNWPKIEKEAGDEYADNLLIDDTPALRATEIRSITRKAKKKHDIDMVVIDYLQLARGDEALRTNGNRYIGDISKSFKSLAKELDIPVLALSQLNRAVESRANPFPILSDLRESGELEQDADIVIFLTRFARLPERYWEDEGKDMKNKAYIDVAKHRNGKAGKILTTASDDAMHWGYDDTFESI